MLEIISKRYAHKAVSFELTFDDEHGSGYAFPCDAQGNVSPDMPEEAKKRLKAQETDRIVSSIV